MPRSSKSRSQTPFNVEEFLRPTDTDLRRALNSLLAVPLEEPAALEGQPETEPKLPVAINSIPGIELMAVTIAPEPVVPLKAASFPVDRKAGRRKFAVRAAANVAEGHSRAEQQVYQAMWDSGEPQADGSRRVTAGILTLSRLAVLSESNTRINLRSLARKLAVEEEHTYNCAQNQGRTWRVYSPEQVLERRQRQGLIWCVKRTLKVVFVDPETGRDLLEEGDCKNNPFCEDPLPVDSKRVF